jgi:hypothetical protein
MAFGVHKLAFAFEETSALNAFYSEVFLMAQAGLVHS